MIRRVDLRGTGLRGRELRGVVPRAALDVDTALEQVRPIVDDVQRRGLSAVVELTERLDGVRLDDVRVPAELPERALAQLDPQVRAALEESIARARRVHRQQRREDRTTRLAAGGTVTERWVPVARVGLYVPGGQAVYPSSVVMNVVPAQEAGVGSIAVASPPQRDAADGYAGLPHPTILAACALLGVQEVYAVGGAQAIAMFAHGLPEPDGAGWRCEPVDLVTGPGNVYVAAAKRLVRGLVGIDAEAGPTEIAVLADDSADPVLVAADMVSQAEHDTLAAAVLITDAPALAQAVESELARQVAATKHSERVAAALAGQQSAIVLVDDLDAGLQVLDAYAGEHVEIQTRDAAAVASRLRNAGAVFVGPSAPVSLGDYCAGSNHVLPTGGCACHTGGLSVQTFLRNIQVVDYDAAALAEVAPYVLALADAEDLPAHGDAVRARLARPRAANHAPADVAALRLPLREDLRGSTPYGAPQLDVPVRLNTNENAYDVPEPVAAAVVAAVREQAGRLNRYPDREFGALRQDLAGYLGHGLDARQLWAGNGSNEVLQHLVQAFGGPGRTALGFTPAYSMHPLICAGLATRWVDGERGGPAEGFDLDAARTADQVARLDPDLVFLCSPNNPTGTALGLDVVEAVYTACRGVVVVDEAYAEFARAGTPSVLTLLPGRERLVVTRTMSKAFALAGARLGYLAAAPELCEALRLVRLPYHLSSITQAAARAALAHAPLLLSTVEAIKQQRDRIVTALPELGLVPVPSDANFVLFGGLDDERAAWDALLERGVLVRDVGLAHHLRVTAGTPEQTTAFLDALRSIR